MPRSRISVTAKILSRSFKPLLYSLVKHNCCLSKRTRLPDPKGKKTVIVGTVKENEYWERKSVDAKEGMLSKTSISAIIDCRCSETNYRSNEEFLNVVVQKQTTDQMKSSVNLSAFSTSIKTLVPRKLKNEKGHSD